MPRVVRRSTNVRPTDEDLLDAVLVAVAESGLGAARMDDIARRADTTKQTLYAHFGSKEALLDRVQQREFDELRSSLFAAYGSLDPRAPLETHIHACVASLYEYASARPHGITVVLDEMAPHYHQRLRDLFGDIVERILRSHSLGFGDISDQTRRAIASMMVSSAIDGNRVAIRDGLDPATAIAVSAGFISAGVRGTLAAVSSTPTARTPVRKHS